jgi:hypothetical protein
MMHRSGSGLRKIRDQIMGTTFLMLWTAEDLLPWTQAGFSGCLMFSSPLDIDDEHHYITIKETLFESLRLY